MVLLQEVETLKMRPKEMIMQQHEESSMESAFTPVSYGSFSNTFQRKMSAFGNQEIEELA